MSPTEWPAGTIASSGAAACTIRNTVMVQAADALANRLGDSGNCLATGHPKTTGCRFPVQCESRTLARERKFANR